MDGRKKKIFLWVQALLCGALALVLILAALTIQAQGMDARRAGDALGWVYTRERMAPWRLPVAAAFFSCLLWAAAGWILGVRGKEKNPWACPIAPQAEMNDPGAARGVALALAVIFIMIGAVNGGWRDVLVKAVNLCAECVGLG